MVHHRGVPSGITILPKIAAIQGLRALAALMVVFGHAQSEASVAALKQGLAFGRSSALPWGAGVDVFFVISGFIMVVSSDRLFAREGGAAIFAARRLKRIVPLYWLFTSLYVLTQLATHKPLGAGNLAASYLFWPRDVYGDGVLRPIYALGWTLDYEMFFYALFAAAIVLRRRVAVTVVTSLLLLGVAVGQAVELPVGPLSFWTQPIVLEFALGMGIGLAWCEGVRLGPAVRLFTFAVATAALAWDGMDAAARSVTWITPTDLARVFAWGLPAAGLVASGALGRGPARSSAWTNPIVALGDASYALYLVHPLIVLTMIRAWTWCGAAHALGYGPFVAMCVVIAVVAAEIVHRRFELPVARLLSRRRHPSVPRRGGAEQAAS